MKALKYIILLILIFPISVHAYSKSVVDITELSIDEIQENVDKGYLTYELVTKLYLERIEEYNSLYNAVITINDKALEEAKEKDEEYKKTGRSSNIFGIPVILKDNIDYVELPTTAGTKALKDSYPKSNSKIVQYLLDEGAIILAKSNMSEFAFSATNSYSSYGHVKNAFNTSFTPYGSSGGSAVSVAASFVPIAIGTDTGSSIRLPSSAASIVGLRPTFELVSTDGIIKYDVTRDTVGPMTKTVRENAEILTILTNNKNDYTSYLDENGLEEKRIGVMNDFIKKGNSVVNILSTYYEEVSIMMNNSIDVMKNNGAEIIYIDDFYNKDYDYIFDTTASGKTLCYQFNKYIKGTTSKIQSFEELLNNGGYVQRLKGYNLKCNENIIESEDYIETKEKIDGFKEEVNKLMDEYKVDVLIYPSLKGKTLTLLESTYKSSSSPCYTIAPITGMPAITVPMGFDSEGFAYGLEIVAKKNREDLLYEIAYSYEQKTKYRQNPSISIPLYKVSEDIEKLKDYYENDKYNKYLFIAKEYNKYKNKYDEVENYLKNYNDMEESNASILLSEYINSKENLLKSKKILFPYIIGFIVVLIIIFKTKKHRRKK